MSTVIGQRLNFPNPVVITPDLVGVLVLGGGLGEVLAAEAAGGADRCAANLADKEQTDW